MKDVVRIEIDAAAAKVARLFADPTLSTQWMEDTRYEPIRGQQGAPGSTYRLVFGGGKMAFTATVLPAQAANESRILLERANVTVHIRADFIALTPNRTLLVSDELFTFKGFLNTVFGFLAMRSIRKVHLRQMQAFKQFVESAAIG